MSPTELAEYDRAYAEAKLAADVASESTMPERPPASANENSHVAWVRAKRPSTASSPVA